MTRKGNEEGKRDDAEGMAATPGLAERVATLDQPRMRQRGMDVKVVERPISVLGSRDIADRVYCSKNQEQALHAAYAGEPFKGPTACDTKGLDANERFAREHGLNATPIIVRGDGAVLEGYRPKEFLEAWLRGGQS